MKQIARVLIENFQSHVRSELAFDRGLNVIIGPSDNGKSAVLRAIRWALYNEPRGSEFMRSGARECRVSVLMSDGAEIVRELLVTKTGAASRNRYTVRWPEGQPQVFEGFGTEVPAEVLKAHGMAQVLLDTDKRVVLSFGSQLEGPFLMSETGSLRARAIGRLLGVHVVDAAARNTQKDLRQARGELARLEREAQRYEAELAPYADIPDQEERLGRAEALLAQAEAMGKRLQQLQRIQTEIDRTDRAEIMVGAQVSRLGDLDQARERLRDAEELQRQARALDRSYLEHQRMEVEIHRNKVRVDALTALPIAEERARTALEHQARLTALSRIHLDLNRRGAELAQVEQTIAQLGQVPRAADLLGEVGAKLQRLERLQQRLAPLQEAGQRLAKGAEAMQQVNQELQGALAEYERVLRQLGKCPTCLQPVEPSSVKRIIAELAGGPASGHHH